MNEVDGALPRLQVILEPHVGTRMTRLVLTSLLRLVETSPKDVYSREARSRSRKEFPKLGKDLRDGSEIRSGPRADLSSRHTLR